MATIANEVKRIANRVICYSVKNQRAAKRIVDKLITTPDDSIILPFLDHPGPLSQEILSRQFGSLTVCEHNDRIRKSFTSHIKKKFPDRNIHVHPDNIFDLSFRVHLDEGQKRCSAIVRESLTRNEETNQVDIRNRRVKLLVPLLNGRYESGFHSHLYYQVAHRMGLCSDTFVHYYFLMSNRHFGYVNAKPRCDMRLYRAVSVLTNTLFKVHELDSFDLKSCFGISLRTIQKTTEKRSLSYGKVHLVWLEPRLDIINNETPRSLIEFRFLIIQMMYRRACLVLPFLQKWFDIRENDIAHLGIGESTRAGDMDVDQHYNLFLYLRSREDYLGSSFTQAAKVVEELTDLE